MPLPTNIQNILNDPQYQADIKLLGGSLAGGTAEKNLAATRVQDTAKRITGEIEKLGLSSPFSSQFLSGALQPFGSGQFLSADEFSGNVQPFGRESFANLFGSPKAAAEYVLGGGQFENLNIPRTQLSTGGFGGGRTLSVPKGSTFQVNPQGIVLKRGDQPALTAEQFAAFQAQNDPRGQALGQQPFASPGAVSGQPDATIGVGGQAPVQTGGQFGNRAFGRVGEQVFETTGGQRRPITEKEFNEKLKAQGLNLEVLPQLGPAGTAGQQEAEEKLEAGATGTFRLQAEQADKIKALEAKEAAITTASASIASWEDRTPEIKEKEKELSDAKASQELGFVDIEGKPVAMAAIIGQQLQLEKRGNVIINRIQRELDILKDDREAQYNKLVRTYDISRQSLTDSIALYKLTQPDKLGFDEKTGTVFFQNPMTGEVYQEKIPGFVPSEDPTALKKEYDEMVRAGYTGTLLEYAAFKAQQFGTEDGGDVKISSTDKTKLLGAGFSSSEISHIEQGVNANGLDEVLRLEKEAGATDAQLKAIQDVYGVEEGSKLTRENLSKLFGISDDDSASFWKFGLGKTNKEKLDELMKAVEQYQAVGYSDDEILKLMKE